MFLSRPKTKFFSLIEIWRWLTHFPMTNFLCIYYYMLKKGLTVSIFNISAFWMVLCFFLLHLMEIFPKTHNVWNKIIIKPCLTAVKYLETTINTKFSTVNHYLTNSKTKKLVLKRRKYHLVWLIRYKFSCQTNFLQVFLINKKWRRLTHFSITNLLSL